jgi:hypothetical protein
VRDDHGLLSGVALSIEEHPKRTLSIYALEHALLILKKAYGLDKQRIASVVH